MLVGDAAGMVSPVTGGGIHTALHFGRRAAQLVSDHLEDRGPHPVRALTTEAPRYVAKRLMRGVLDLALPNMLINPVLMTGAMRGIAQRLYFHARRGDDTSFEDWSRAFDSEAVNRSARSPSLRCIEG
jgi:flavin-dependent dehydrogenase